MAASATFALKVGVWFRRSRLFMVSPDSLGTACPLSGRKSTYRPVQISETSSVVVLNKSTTVRIPQPFSKVIVGAADVADVLPATAYTLYIQGKKIGTTNVSIFDEAGKLFKIFDIEVTLETVSLEEKIHASMGNRGIQ